VAVGVPAIFPAIIGNTYRKSSAVFVPWKPVLKEKVALPHPIVA